MPGMSSRKGAARIAALALAFLLAALPALAQGRVALVIGNGAYRAVPRLPNPISDASAVAESLRAAGFAVDLVRDAGKETMEGALRRFAAAVDGAELALFYFAGHGVQIGGDNHLLPVDARLAHARDVDFELVGLPLVLRAMQGARARVLILDACRDNPLAAQMRGLSATRSVGRGLARIENVDLGTLIAFSTSPGAVALDGAGRNSPFTAALVQHLATPGLEVRQLMTRVRRSVVEATGGQQIPWDNSSLISEVVLRPGRGPAGPTVAMAAPPAAAAVPPAQPVQPRRSEPAAMPAPPVALPQEFAAARQVAARQGIPLPPDMPAATAGRGAHPLVGIWGGDPRWNRIGRHLMLFVLSVDSGSGTADIILAGGGGAPRSVSDGLLPGWSRHRAQLRDSSIAWTDVNGDDFQARRNDFLGEVVEIVQRRNRTIGGQANPVGQIGLSRLQ